MSRSYIYKTNVRENRRGNRKWTIQRHSHYFGTRHRTKIQLPVFCVKDGQRMKSMQDKIIKCIRNTWKSSENYTFCFYDYVRGISF